MIKTLARIALSWSFLGVVTAESRCLADTTSQDTTVMLQSRAQVSTHTEVEESYAAIGKESLQSLVSEASSPRKAMNEKTSHMLQGSSSTLIGRCLQSLDNRPVDYLPAAMMHRTNAAGLTAKKIWGFANESLLGMYNPSLVELPASVTSTVHPSAKFAMTFRRDHQQCEKLVKKSSNQDVSKGLDDSLAPGELALLDADYCIVASCPMNATNPIERSQQDARLFVHNDELYASYVEWQSIPGVWKGKGFWMAPVTIQHSPSTGLTAQVDSLHGVRMGAVEEKNFGLFHFQGSLMALTWINWDDRPAIQTDNFQWRAPDEKVKWHNSANLLQLQDGSGDLIGVMHKHMGDPSEQNDDGKSSNVFYAGSGYVQRFFRLSGQPPFHMKGVGKEFCITIDEQCESVQFVMSIIHALPDELHVSYGLNDCESRVASFALSDVLQGMAPPPAGKETVQMLRVPKARYELSAMAESLSPAPLWPLGSDRDNDTIEMGLHLAQSVDSKVYETCSSATAAYGDWPVCKDWLSSQCVVYDIGLANEWEFSDNMARQHGCEVHAFDSSDKFVKEHMSHDTKNVQFHFLGLSGGDESHGLKRDFGDRVLTQWVGKSEHDDGHVGAPLKRLDDIMAQLGHKAIDVLKIDCQGCEWSSLASVVRASPRTLTCVHVILMELNFAKRRLGSNESLADAGEIFTHLNTQGWKPWFAVQRGWGPDRLEQELDGWNQAGGDSCCYNVGLLNPHYDARQCLSS